MSHITSVLIFTSMTVPNKRGQLIAHHVQKNRYLWSLVLVQKTLTPDIKADCVLAAALISHGIRLQTIPVN